MSEATREHAYDVRMVWTGSRGEGTTSYRSYSRDHEILAGAKPAIAGSSDPTFRGDASRYNPEELLVASLSSCHMLWYLHLCADAGIVVLAYEDDARGRMIEDADGGGHFEEVTLRPRVEIRAGFDRQRALELHHRAHELCFIARSVTFPVHCEPILLEA